MLIRNRGERPCLSAPKFFKELYRDHKIIMDISLKFVCFASPLTDGGDL